MSAAALEGVVFCLYAMVHGCMLAVALFTKAVRKPISRRTKKIVPTTVGDSIAENPEIQVPLPFLPL